jgi:hypothetical protein
MDEIGVLFVHGIGQQRRGETLVEFGEPLHRWVSRWLTFVQGKWLEQDVSKQELMEWFERLHGGAVKEEKLLRYEILRPLFDRARKTPRGPARRIEEIAKLVDSPIVSAQVRLNNAALLPIPTELQAPPQASLDLLLLMVDGSVKRSTWLLAESWWADAFTAPRFRDLAWWGLFVLPWTVSSHFGARIRRAFKKLGDAKGLQHLIRALPLLLHCLEFFIGLVLVLSATELVLLLLLALSPIRISFVGRFVASVQRMLAGIVGDSYAVVARPIQAAAVTGQIRRDLEWLTTRCQSVVIVAHSQGAAVAHLTLRSSVPPAVKTLLTFGSGLRKLEELRLAETSKEFTAGIFSFLGVLLAVVAIVLLAKGGTVWFVVVIFSALILLAGGAAQALKGIGDAEVSYWAKLFKDRPIAWEDYYASADPVPNGPLLDEDEDGLMRSVEIRNRGSVVGDHTTYWKNLDQFVSSVACTIGRLGPIDLTSTSFRDKLVLDMAHQRRRWRVEWLRGTKWIVAALSVGVAYAHWSDLAELGASLRTSLPPLPPLSTTGSIHDVVGFWNLLGPAGDQALGAAALLGAAYVSFVVMRGCWEWWNATDVEVFFSRRVFVTGRTGVPFFVFCAVNGTFATLGASALVAPLWSLTRSYFAGAVAAVDLAVGSLLSAIVLTAVARRDKRAREMFSQSANRRFDAVPDVEPNSAELVPREITEKLQDMANGKQAPGKKVGP